MKMRNWVRQLSLSQQLFALIVLFVTFFVFFFFFYINTNIDSYTQEQMYARLEDSQDTLLYYYEQDDIKLADVIKRSDSNITNYFFFADKDGKFTSEGVSAKAKKTSTYKEIYNNLLLLSNVNRNSIINNNNSYEYTLSDSGTYTYYVIRSVDSNTYVVSLLNNKYTSAFKSGLLDNVIDITVFVVGGFFIILMLWVANIIHPLNQIKNYIEKVKLGKDADLKIDRQDEIGEVADALVSMRTELIKQEKTKEEMIHNISHDLKTPIATIKSYGESIKDGVYPYDTLEKSVDVIIANAQRLEKKVHSLLFLNRVEYLISQEGEVEIVDMQDIVETVVLNTKVIRPEIEIETNLHESLFQGNEEAWRVCVENILENALRYAKTQIVITLDEDQLCIYNDGRQMKEDRISRLFKPYEMGEGGQFGLGLSIVHKVVTANGYSVVAENVETGGVIFIIKK